jgi:hypothetical protein
MSIDDSVFGNVALVARLLNDSYVSLAAVATELGKPWYVDASVWASFLGAIFPVLASIWITRWQMRIQAHAEDQQKQERNLNILKVCHLNCVMNINQLLAVKRQAVEPLACEVNSIKSFVKSGNFNKDLASLEYQEIAKIFFLPALYSLPLSSLDFLLDDVPIYCQDFARINDLIKTLEKSFAHREDFIRLSMRENLLGRHLNKNIIFDMLISEAENLVVQVDYLLGHVNLTIGYIEDYIKRFFPEEKALNYEFSPEHQNFMDKLLDEVKDHLEEYNQQVQQSVGFHGSEK